MARRQPVVQVIGQLCGVGTPSVDAGRAKAVVLAWLRDKQRLKLPPQAEAGEAFNLDASEGQPLVIARFRNFWAMRLDKLDGEVAGRIWRTEVSIGHDEKAAMVGVRLTVIDTSKSVPIWTSIPRVVNDLIESPGIKDYGIQLTVNPASVSTQDSVNELVKLLINPERTRPVVVVASGCGVTSVEVAEMASRLAGIVHVYVATDNAIEILNGRLGNDFAISLRGLRTFLPKFNPKTDEISEHPPATTEWIMRRFGSFGKFVWMLLGRFALRTVSGPHVESGMPSVDEVEAAEAEARLVELAKQGERSEREKLLEQQVARLERAVKEKIQEYDYAARCVAEAEDERNRYRAQVYAAQQRVTKLEEKIGGDAVKVDTPDNFDHLNEWVLEHFPGRLQLLGRALRAAKKSSYEDKPLVYRCLAKLGRDYVDARRSGLPVDGIFESLGVHLERTGSRSHLSQWQEEYFFSLRAQSEFLEWHITKGKDHNENTTLRIYFYYDEEDGVAIVGHLTSHLTNEAT